MTMPEWFCTKCKNKFKTDKEYPHCPACGSGYVLNNRVVEPVLSFSETGQGEKT